MQRLAAVLEEYLHHSQVEKGATNGTIRTYRFCFHDFTQFASRKQGGTVMLHDFDVELCREYQYDMKARELETNTMRLRLSALASFGKWAMRRRKIAANPLDMIDRPKRRRKLPTGVPKWNLVELLMEQCKKYRDKALLAVMIYGGLRRSEVVALDIGDYDGDFGFRRVKGKGGFEAAVALPKIARAMIDEYLATERPKAKFNEPLFLVRYKKYAGPWKVERMDDHRVWRIVKDLGRKAGVPELHPHSFRHACAVEMLKRNGGNLRVVQDHLRHLDIGTTAIYTSLAQLDMVQAVSMFDQNGKSGSHAVEGGTETKPT